MQRKKNDKRDEEKKIQYNSKTSFAHANNTYAHSKEDHSGKERRQRMKGKIKIVFFSSKRTVRLAWVSQRRNEIKCMKRKAKAKNRKK